MRTLPTLYQLTQREQEILSELIEQQGEFNPEQEEELSLIQEELLPQKLSGYHKLIAYLEGQLIQITHEETRLKRYKQRVDKAVDNLKKRVLEAVLLIGNTRGREEKVRYLSYGSGEFSTRRSEKVVILDERGIPDYCCTYELKLTAEEFNMVCNAFPYLRNKGTANISKTRIKEVMQAGTIIPGAKIETVYHLK